MLWRGLTKVLGSVPASFAELCCGPWEPNMTAELHTEASLIPNVNSRMSHDWVPALLRRAFWIPAMFANFVCADHKELAAH